MKVLVADDDIDFATALTSLVRACDHEVVATVTKGGLAVIQSYAEHRPDVVLLDVMQPRLNGFTVCRALLSRDPSAKVVLISGAREQWHPSMKNCGASGYLQKPLIFDELREVLDRVPKPELEESEYVSTTCEHERAEEVTEESLVTA